MFALVIILVKIYMIAHENINADRFNKKLLNPTDFCNGCENFTLILRTRDFLKINVK